MGSAARANELIWAIGRIYPSRQIKEIENLLSYVISDEAHYRAFYEYLVNAPYIAGRKDRAVDYDKRWYLFRRYLSMIQLLATVSADTTTIDTIMSGLSSPADLAATEISMRDTLKTIIKDLFGIALSESAEVNVTDELINVLRYAKGQDSAELKEVIKRYVESGQENAWAYVKGLSGNEPYAEEAPFLQGPGEREKVIGKVENVEAYIAKQKQTLYDDVLMHLNRIKGDYPADTTLIADIDAFKSTLTGKIDSDVTLIKNYINGREANPEEGIEEIIGLKQKDAGSGGIDTSNKNARDINDRISNIENMRMERFYDSEEKVTIYVSHDPIEALNLGVGFSSCLNILDGEYKKDALVNMLDLNKRVIYVKNSNGKRIGRLVVALVYVEGKKALLPISRFYTNTTLNLEGAMLTYLKAYSEHLGIPLLMTDNVIADLCGTETVLITLGRAFSLSVHNDFEFSPGGTIEKKNVWRYTPDGTSYDAELPVKGTIQAKKAIATDLDASDMAAIKTAIGSASVRSLDNYDFDTMNTALEAILEVVRSNPPPIDGLTQDEIDVINEEQADLIGVLENRAIENNRLPDEYKRYGEAIIEYDVADLGAQKTFPVVSAGSKHRGPIAFSEYKEEGGKLILHVYITKAFLEENLTKDNVHIIAQAIRHELDEKALGKTHLEAVIREEDLDKDGYDGISDLTIYALGDNAQQTDGEYADYLANLISNTAAKITELETAAATGEILESTKNKAVVLARKVCRTSAEILISLIAVTTDHAARTTAENALKAIDFSQFLDYTYFTAPQAFFDNFEGGAHAGDDYIAAGQVLIVKSGIANPNAAIAAGMAKVFFEIKKQEDAANGTNYINSLMTAAGFADDAAAKDGLAALAREVYGTYKTGGTLTNPLKDIFEIQQYFKDLSTFMQSNNILTDPNLPISFNNI